MGAINARLRSGAKAALRLALARLPQERVELPPSLWRLARDEAGYLCLDRVRLADLIARFGSPLFVIDAARLAQNAAEFSRVPSGAAAGVECYYSYKTNPIPAALSRLHDSGVGAEVISEFELWLAQRLGVPGPRIVLNGPGRTMHALKSAVELGALIHINHREEIAPLAEIARAAGKACRVGVRVVTSRGWGGQFGESIAGGSALACYRELAQRPEFEVCSLHTHVGGEIADAAALRAVLRELLDFYGVLRTQLGLAIEIVDFGGSLVCPTTSHPSERAQRLNRALGIELQPRPPEQVLTIGEYVRELVQGVEARCRGEGWPRPRIFAEPGRALTGNAQLLLCSVTGLKQSGAASLPHAILDAGINIAEPLRNEYHAIFVAGPESTARAAYRLVGPICTPMDTLAWSRSLPALQSGSVLCIADAGAYFVPFSTSFSFAQPAAVMVEGSDTKLVRRAERFEDLVRRDAARALQAETATRIVGTSDPT